MQILITGATGLIGGELATKLVAANHAVVGLTRSKTEIRSNDGTLLPTKPVQQDVPAPGEMLTVRGDINEPDCGLQDELVERLSGNIELIIHCAAATGFDAEPCTYTAVNVEGTKNVRELIPCARFLYVSTAYACGLQNGSIPEVLHGPKTIFMNGYEESKCQAETYVLGSGENVVIARPSIVVGDYNTGQIKTFDTVYTIFRLLAEGLITAVPTAPDASFDYVPIDHVIGGLMDIIDHWDAAKGKIFHLSSGNPIPPQMLADALGTFAQLHKPELVAINSFSFDKLSSQQQRFYKKIMSYYVNYFDRNPRFVTENLKQLSGRSCPPIDMVALQRLIKFCIDAGFVGNRKKRYERTSG